MLMRVSLAENLACFHLFASLEGGAFSQSSLVVVVRVSISFLSYLLADGHMLFWGTVYWLIEHMLFGDWSVG